MDATRARSVALGSGAAFVAEAGVLLLALGECAPAPFVQILLPTFQVTQTIYPGDRPASVPLLLLGLRLLL